VRKIITLSTRGYAVESAGFVAAAPKLIRRRAALAAGPAVGSRYIREFCT
jgi:hypothetical protein